MALKALRASYEIAEISALPIAFPPESGKFAQLIGVLLASLCAALLSVWRPVMRGLGVNPIKALRADKCLVRASAAK